MYEKMLNRRIIGRKPVAAHQRKRKMGIKTKALKAAFPYTLPILAGFLFLGIAYGIYMQSKGFPFWWPTCMALFIFAGSMEFVTVDLLTAAYHPLYALGLALIVNARHLFYGISMLEPYRGTGKKKWYLIFGMCDESFSINCSTEPPEGVDKGWFYFFVTLLNHAYWVVGATLGGLLGSFVFFDTTSIDFVMTALFVVIFLDQWKTKKGRVPAAIGVGTSVVALTLFGAADFILPAMALMLAVLTLLRKSLTKGEKGV